MNGLLRFGKHRWRRPIIQRRRLMQHLAPTAHSPRQKTAEEKRAERRMVLAGGTLVVALLPVGGPLLFINAGVMAFTMLPIIRAGWMGLARDRRLNVDSLVTLNVLGGLLVGLYALSAVGMLLYYASEKLIYMTQDRSMNALLDIFGHLPRSVRVLRDNGQEVEMALDDITPEDRVIVQAGQTLALDGTVAEGSALVDQHMLTGESRPAEKEPGSEVFASSVVLSGHILVRPTATGSDTVAARITDLLNRTASYQTQVVSQGQRVADRWSVPTLLAGLVAIPLTGVQGGLAIFGASIGFNVRFTAPLAMLNFLRITAANSILIKDGRSLDLLSEVDTVVFDKTGTLTTDTPFVAAIHAFNGYDERDVLCYAASAETGQSHPIAQAIRQAADQRGIPLLPVDATQYEIGFGLRVQVAGRLVRLGSERFFERENLTLPPDLAAFQQTARADGDSLVLLGVDDVIAGALRLQPGLRPEVTDVIAHLRARGMSLAIISGDSEEPTRKLANDLGISVYFPNTLPDNKAAIIRTLQDQGRSVCFVGDGINDGVALKQAQVSVSLAGATTVATDVAQVILMDRGLRHLPDLFNAADDFQANTQAGLRMAVIPGFILVGGVYTLGWGIGASYIVWIASLLAGIGIAFAPLRRQRPPIITASGTPRPAHTLPPGQASQPESADA